jgi:hypothetical protein
VRAVPGVKTVRFAIFVEAPPAPPASSTGRGSEPGGRGRGLPGAGEPGRGRGVEPNQPQ